MAALLISVKAPQKLKIYYINRALSKLNCYALYSKAQPKHTFHVKVHIFKLLGEYARIRGQVQCVTIEFQQGPVYVVNLQFLRCLD